MSSSNNILYIFNTSINLVVVKSIACDAISLITTLVNLFISIPCVRSKMFINEYLFQSKLFTDKFNFNKHYNLIVIGNLYNGIFIIIF